jgi:hypothetical protein
MLFVTLDSALAACQAAGLGSTLDFLLVSTTAHDARIGDGERVSHILAGRI